MSQQTLLDKAAEPPSEAKADAIAPRRRGRSDPFFDMLERIASNPAVDVAKMEQIIDLQRGIMHDNAKAAFDAAFSAMWPELPEIDERGYIKNKDGSIKSRYARYEDIQAAIRPILARFGFAMRHRTEFPADKPGIIRIVGILSGHGHSEESFFEAPPDKNDYRTAIQDQGSTNSYGKRYTTCDLLNIITRGVDDDGVKSGRPPSPEGYEQWFKDLSVPAARGFKSLEQAWSVADPAFKNYAVKNDKQRYAELKAGAVAVDRG